LMGIGDKGPPSRTIQHHSETRVFNLYQTLFSMVSDQYTGVLQRAIVVVGSTAHKVPVHSKPTSEDCGKPFG
ncbi:hypothetical protein QBC45DRAFT_334763, partial [Copromyces sp. CBS 386.78]